MKIAKENSKRLNSNPILGFPDGSVGKESAFYAGYTGGAGSVPGSGRSL